MVLFLASFKDITNTKMAAMNTNEEFDSGKHFFIHSNIKQKVNLKTRATETSLPKPYKIIPSIEKIPYVFFLRIACAYASMLT